MVQLAKGFLSFGKRRTDTIPHHITNLHTLPPDTDSLISDKVPSLYPLFLSDFGPFILLFRCDRLLGQFDIPVSVG
jgi:hypothetical protein